MGSPLVVMRYEETKGVDEEHKQQIIIEEAQKLLA